MNAELSACSAEEGFVSQLVERERLTALSAERLRRVQLETGDRVSAVILKLGLLSEADLAAEMARYVDLPPLGLAPATAMNHDSLNLAFLKAHEVVPIRIADQQLEVVCWDALDDYVPKALEFATGLTVRQSIARRTQVLELLGSLEPTSTADTHEIAVNELAEDEEIARLKDLASEAPVIRLVQRVIADAVASRASDIHFEPSEARFHIRFRLDGVLREVENHPKDLGPSMASRIKVMAGLNIAERRLPQDGRIRVAVQGKEIDFRVATSPALHGETVVLRILDRQDIALDFDALGFDESLKEIVRGAIAKPYGIILVTGPTGSGKTTTLYAALKEINTPDKKILTVEDPVEYVLHGVSQVPLKPQIGLTFANALRAFLRQDPDVMMVGEIRDRETADIAIQAALTGHLLLSTLHTNTAAAAITRLLDMGIDDYLLTSTLHVILGQRLVRKLCTTCRQQYEPSQDVRERFSLEPGVYWYRAGACAACQGMGFQGRTTIVEALLMTDAVRSRVLARCDAHEIERTAVEQGMRTLFLHGLDRVNAGVTTIEEVLRVTNLD